MDARLPSQVGKLAHDLEEIRVRALRSIISKLDLGVINEKDLIDEKEIFPNLINWFNATTVPCKKEVLQLIGRLAKYRDGAFYLHVFDPNLSTLIKCTGPEFKKEICEISKLLEAIHNYSGDQFNDDSRSIVLSANASQSGTVEDLYEVEEDASVCEEAIGYKGIYWPLPELNESDKKLLRKVAQLLNKVSISTTSQAADFFSTVLIHDFPPQIFLYETTILNALFQLKRQGEGGATDIAILKCFKEFTISLHRQFNFYNDRSTGISRIVEGRDSDGMAVCAVSAPTSHPEVGELCSLSLYKLCEAVPEVLRLLKICLGNTTQFWSATNGQVIKSNVINTLALLSSKITSARFEDPIARLELQIWTNEVLGSLVPISAAPHVINVQLQQVLAQELFDPTLAILYPTVHSSLKTYVASFLYQDDNGFEIFESLAESLKAAVKLQKMHKQLATADILSLFHLSVAFLDIHEDFTMIQVFLETILQGELLPSQMESSENIILALMAHDDERIRSEIYLQLLLIVNEYVGPESVRHRSRRVLDQIPFILNSNILIETIIFGVTSSTSQISKAAKEILTLVLKSKMGLESEDWMSLLSVIGTCLPLLESLASNTTIHGKTILQMLDPDVAIQIPLYKLQILTGNVRFLFSKDAEVVCEGYSRLTYLLDLPSGSSQVFSIPQPPLVYSEQPFNLFNEENVRKLADVFKTLDDEEVLKSAVLQVSLITEDPVLQMPLLEAGILPKLLHILFSSLNKMNEDTREMYGSVVLALKNFALHNIQLRHDFSVNYDLYAAVIKGLFLLPAVSEREKTDRYVRDAVQLLFLMVYSDQFESLNVRTGVAALSLPNLLLTELKSPFHLTPTQSSLISEHRFPSKKKLLIEERSSRDERRGSGNVLLGAMWACEMAGGADKLGIVGKIPVPYPLEPPHSSSLINLHHRIHVSLIQLSIASSHQEASESLRLIYRYICLLKWTAGDYDQLEWEQSFTRYLITVPASPPDQMLLIQIIQLLQKLMTVLPSQVAWVCRMMSDPSLMIASLLTQTTAEHSTALMKQLSVALLELLAECILLDTKKEHWEFVGQSLLESLNHSHSHKFYSLGILERLLTCLLTLTRLHPSPPSPEPFWHLLSAFHCSNRNSFMGITITRKILFCLNSALKLPKVGKDLKVYPEGVMWLKSLLLSRDCLIVAGTLELSSRLPLLVSHASDSLSSHLSQSALRILLDNRQGSMIREQAAYLCYNIVSNSQGKMFVTEFLANDIFKCFTDILMGFIKLSKKEDVSIYDPNLAEEGNISMKWRELNTGYVTVGLLKIVSQLTVALILKDKVKVIASALSTGFLPALIRDVTNWRCRSGMRLAYQSQVDMYEAIMAVFVQTSSDPLPSTLSDLCLIQPLSTFVWLLLPSTYEKSIRFEGLLRESLWVLGLLLSDLEDKEQGEKRLEKFLLPDELVESLSYAALSDDQQLSQAAIVAIPHLIPFLSQKGCVELVKRLSSIERLRCVLSSIVGYSESATNAALTAGLLEEVIAKLSRLQLSLAHAPRQSTKVMSLLEEVCTEVGLLTNLLGGSPLAKEKAATLGLADCFHKLWNWYVANFNLLSAFLRALVTFTASSSAGAGTLVLTSTLAGVGQRKSPTSSSLLHVVLCSISKQVFPTQVKLLFLQLLCHSCQAVECRTVLAKASFLTEFLDVSEQRKNGQVDELETGWLDFLTIFTNYTEGQTALIKNEEVIEKLLIYLTGSRGDKHKSVALSVLRNIIFNQTNKQRFILSEKILSTILEHLTEKDLSESHILDVLLIGWLLSANSQRGKASVRAIGLHTRIDSIFQQQPLDSRLHAVAEIVLPIISPLHDPRSEII